jgi:hypothetical protein
VTGNAVLGKDRPDVRVEIDALGVICGSRRIGVRRDNERQEDQTAGEPLKMDGPR